MTCEKISNWPIFLVFFQAKKNEKNMLKKLIDILKKK